MTLLSLKPSPYSRRVVWSLELLGFEYAKEEYVSIAGEPGLRWRLGRLSPWQCVTVPIAFISNGKEKNALVLENGVEIVEWANDKKTSSGSGGGKASNTIESLIPAALRPEVMQCCQLADDFQNFDRGMFLRALKQHPPSVLRAVVGDGPPSCMLHVIGFLVGFFMRTKYDSTLQATIDEIKQKAQKLEETLKAKQAKSSDKSSLVFVVGDDLTMADIFLSVAICGGVKDRSKPKSDHQKRMEQALHSQGFSMEEKYPALYQWAVQVSETYKVNYALFEDEKE